MASRYLLKTNNSLEKFRKVIQGRKNIPRDIDSDIHSSGDFKTLEGIDSIVKGIVNTLLTCDETYLFDPMYGIGLQKYIFEPCDFITKESIENEVKKKLSKYEDRANVTPSVSFFKNKKGFRIDLVIKYEGQQKSVHINMDESLLKTLDSF